MILNSKIKALFSVTTLISCSVYAQENSAPAFQLEESPLTATIKTTPSESTDVSSMSFDELTATKTITLMRIAPSSSQIEKSAAAHAKAPAELDYSKGINPSFQVDLGMNSVPVLDQGQYGTCVTFAATAAVDAIIGKGDYVSQQCSLELDKALGHNYWNGANDATEIINPLKNYGVVPKTVDPKSSKPTAVCPTKYPSTTAKITASSYQKLSLFTDVSKVNDVYHSTITRDQVKTALNNKHRVAIGTMLLDNADPISVEGFDITVNGAHKTGGLWACKQGSSASFCGQSNAGHEVVIVGYDDAQQLFKIRNSWDTVVGDSGTFYMTYAFFDAMVLDGTEVY